MTAEEFDAYQKRVKQGRFGAGMKPSKHRAIKTEVDGEKFDSKLEARVYQELKLREAAGEIRNLRRQVKHSLFGNHAEHIGTYTADFTWDEMTDNVSINHTLVWRHVVADCKSSHTRKLPGWGRTKKLMLACHGIAVRELP